MQKTIFFFLTAFLLLSTSALVAQDKSTKTNEENKDVDKEIVVIETNLGNIEIAMYREDAPRTVENFVQHAKDGYYDGVIFHRVIKGFMIQGGDPTGTGSGGSSIYGAKFDDEIVKGSELYKTGYKRGVVAMANAGPNTNGSQFFIMHNDNGLPPAYTIFGVVVDGMDTVDKIATTKTGGPQGSSPIEKVTMTKVYVK